MLFGKKPPSAPSGDEFVSPREMRRRAEALTEKQISERMRGIPEVPVEKPWLENQVVIRSPERLPIPEPVDG